MEHLVRSILKMNCLNLSLHTYFIYLSLTPVLLCFLQKENFIGKEALIKQREQGVKRRFVQLLLQDSDYETDPWPWGGEPIYLDDRVIGRVTTTAYGFTLNCHVRIEILNTFIYSGLHLSPHLASTKLLCFVKTDPINSNVPR